MAVLVTRPHPDDEATASACARGVLRCCGRRCCGSSRSPFHDDADARYGAIIVTSANALRAIAPHLAASRLLKLPLFAVGEHTASAARDAGFGEVIAAKGDAGALRDLVLAACEIEATEEGQPAALSGRRRSCARSCRRTRREGFYGRDADDLPDGSGVQPAARNM